MRGIPLCVVVEGPVPHETRESRAQPPHDLLVVRAVRRLVLTRGGALGGPRQPQAQHRGGDVVFVRPVDAHRAAVVAI